MRMRLLGRAALLVLVGGILPVAAPVAHPPAQAAMTGVLPFDFNGDGYADLAAGVPGEDIGSIDSAGAVNVIRGSEQGLTAVGDQIWHQDRSGVKGAAEKYDTFGRIVASGDFDADGYADLAIGVPGEKLDGKAFAGAVNVLYGSPTGLTAAGDQMWHQGSAGVPGSNERDDQFGASLAAGDFDADGFADLVVGVPGESIGDLGGGQVLVLRGSANGLTAVGCKSWSQATPGIPDDPQGSPSDGFGWAVASGRFNGDRYADLAISAPNEDVATSAGGGAVHVLFGSSTGLTAAGTQFLTGRDMGIVTERGEGGLGTALVAADFNADSRDDLAVGNADAAGYTEGGAVAVLYSAGSGFDAAAAEWWTLDDPVLPGSVQIYEAFGAALAAGDVTRDGVADLAIGARGLTLTGVVPEPEIEYPVPGAVYLLVGGRSGLIATSTALSKPNEWANPDDSRGAMFGGSLAVLPLSGEEGGWLVVGTGTDDVEPGVDAGSVTVYPSSPSGPVDTSRSVWHQGTVGIKGTPELLDMFGSISGTR